MREKEFSKAFFGLVAFEFFCGFDEPLFLGLGLFLRFRHGWNVGGLQAMSSDEEKEETEITQEMIRTAEQVLFDYINAHGDLTAADQPYCSELCCSVLVAVLGNEFSAYTRGK